ncbi:glycerophosphodiester phosphodiesterase [Actinomadura sp. 9N407]|uniref:glycerophosphodiester phosphodiesterase n=1 Tax=Actinomadura sp. 9N407 TaxID=3375154 RepID=UPI00379097C4
MERGVAISAHRRDSAGLAGLHDAAASGAEYVEIDVRRTSDGALVVHHDAAVAGVPLSRCPYPRLRELAPRPVPLVAEALEIIRGRARGHLDLKERGCEHEAVALALAAFGPDGFVVTTREPASIAQIKRRFPEVTTALSVGRGFWERGAAVRDYAPLRAIRECGADLVAINHRLARVGVLGRCARAGLPAMVWTVNAEPLMSRFLADPRVAVLITDFPGTALRLRG